MGAGETSCNDLAMSSLGMRECLRGSAGSLRLERCERPRRSRGRGIGVACGFFVSGAGYPIYRSRTPHCTVEIKVDEAGGGVEVRSGAAEIGQGCETMMATIAAETLGIPLERGARTLGRHRPRARSRRLLEPHHAHDRTRRRGKLPTRSAADPRGAWPRSLEVPVEELSFTNGLLTWREVPERSGPFAAST